VEAVIGSNDDMSMRYSAEGDVVNSLDRMIAKRSPQNDSDSDEYVHSNKISLLAVGHKKKDSRFLSKFF
jgi:hypothetical protein